RHTPLAGACRTVRLAYPLGTRSAQFCRTLPRPAGKLKKDQELAGRGKVPSARQMLSNDRALGRLLFAVGLVFPGRFPPVEMMRRKLLIQYLEGRHKAGLVAAHRSILIMPLELFGEERRRGRFGDPGFPGQVVAADGFLDQAAPL